MKTRYSVTLDRMSLDAIAPEIMIIDILCNPPGFLQNTSTLQNRNGQIFHGRTIGQTNVSVVFEIHTQNVKRRQRICMDVQRWAMKGKVLRTGSRPGQRLYVRCSGVPVITSELKWTGKLTVGFTADEKPFWEDEEELETAVQGGQEAMIYVQGSVERIPVDVVISNNGAKRVDSLTVSAGDTLFAFENLGLEAGKTLEIGHDERGFLTISAGGESVMNKRTAESSDELMIRQNEREKISILADSNVKAAFRYRGMWM